MKILVLGAGGMAGHVIATYLEEVGHKVTTVSGSNKLNHSTHLIDATDASALTAFLNKNSFDIVINCIGVLVKKSEERKDLASYLNGYLPHFLEYFYKDSRTRLIHLSTDCVFSGRNAPYYENSPFDGETFYDRSKALGEVVNDKDLTFRMSIVGPDMQQNGIGLFNWFYAQTKKIDGYTKAIWSGVTTIELAKAIEVAIQQNLTGLYHLVPKESISKFNLLELFKATFDKNDVSIAPNNKVSIDKTLINTRKDFNYTVPDYKTMVDEMQDWINTHKGLYPHYE